MKISQHMITPGAPVSMERVLSDREAQVRRETRGDDAQMIPCPGGCGGLARLESPMTIIRGGQVRTCRMAECQQGCKVEIVRGRHGKPRMVAARYELPVEPEALGSSPQPAPEQTVSAARVQPLLADGEGSRRSQSDSELAGASGLSGNGSGEDAPDLPPAEQPQGEDKGMSTMSLPIRMASVMKKAQLTQVEVAKVLGCSQSSISKMLRGLPVVEGMAEAALAWIETVHDAPEATEAVEQMEPPEKSLVEERYAAEPSENCFESAPQTSANLPIPGQAPAEKASVPPVEQDSEPTAEADGMSPYESILRTLLEEVAQRRLEELAGFAARGVKVRVTLEWHTEPSS